MKTLHQIYEDLLPGGLGDDASDSKFDKKQLALGIKHEMEHTKDKRKAKEIAKDHLSEDPRYYTKLKEALAPQDVQKTVSKYLTKVQDEKSRSDFLMQAAMFLGRQSNVNPEDLDLALRTHYAKNYDPAKLARKQTPAQQATAQTKTNPPPVPSKNATAPAQKAPQAANGMPSLQSLSAEEDPVWKKYNLPSPDELEKSAQRQGSPSGSDDVPEVDPNDVEPVKAEPDSKKEPEDKKDEPKKGSGVKKKKVGRKASDTSIPMPSFGSVLRSQMQSQNARTGAPKWDIGQTVNVGASKGYKVTGKTGNFWNLEKNGERYVFRPFKGLKKVAGKSVKSPD